MTRTARPKVPATSPTSNHMPTSFLLLAQYGGRAFIPIEEVCRDFFAHLTPDALMRKVTSGDVRLPVMRTDAGSQKTAKGVHLSDLADYLDERRAAAKKEMAQLTGGRVGAPIPP